MGTASQLHTPESIQKAKAARTSRRDKMKAYSDTFDKMRRTYPRMALPIIDQAEKGSLPAAIKLMCLDCSNWVRTEVRDCVIAGCPLYPHRPFQRIKGRNPNDP